MLRGIVLMVCLAVPHVAHATVVGGGEDRTLLGWSDDGSTWAVLRDRMGTKTLAVLRRGKIVLELCNRLDVEIDMFSRQQLPNSCKKTRNVIVVSIQPRKHNSGLVRINIATHRALKRFKLKPVSAKWRSDFNKKFRIKHGPHGPNLTNSGRCSHGWSLLRAVDNKRVSHNAPGPCVRALGGYLSSDGKYALVKLSSSSYVFNGSTGGFHSVTAYEWIAL